MNPWQKYFPRNFDAVPLKYVCWSTARARTNLRIFINTVNAHLKTYIEAGMNGHETMREIDKILTLKEVANHPVHLLSFSKSEQRFFVKPLDIPLFLLEIGGLITVTEFFPNVSILRESLFGTKRKKGTLHDWQELLKHYQENSESVLKNAADYLKSHGFFMEKTGPTEHFDEAGNWSWGYPSLEIRMELLRDFIEVMEPIVAEAASSEQLFLNQRGRVINGEYIQIKAFEDGIEELKQEAPSLLQTDLKGHYCL